MRSSDEMAASINKVLRLQASGQGLAFEALAQTEDVEALVDALSSPSKLALDSFEGGIAELKACVLQFAIHQDNLDLVRALVEQGGDIKRPTKPHERFRWKFDNDSTSQEAFPIYFAQSKAMVELLESLGAKLGVSRPTVSGGENALFPAIRFGNLGYTKYLVSRGICVHHANKKGRTALHCAVSGGTYKDVNLLLAAGADVNAVDRNGSTPLMVCLDSDQNKATLSALLDGGADLFARDNKGHHRLFMLTKRASIELVVKRIVQNAAAGVVMDRGIIFDLACNLTTLKFLSFARQIMECGAFDCKVRGVKTTTPVHEAAYVAKDWDGLQEFIEVALEHGFDLESRNTRGYTALMQAISGQNCLAVQILLQKGADLHATTENGTPAHRLTRDAAIKAELYSAMTAASVSSSVDAGLENGIDKDTMGGGPPKKAKTGLGML